MYGIFHQFLKIHQIIYILFLHLKFPYKMIHKLQIIMVINKYIHLIKYSILS